MTAADSNILFDILLDDPTYGEASTRALQRALQTGPVVICPVVYTELAAQFPSGDEIDRFLRDITVRVEPFSLEALRLAARAWQMYRQQRGQAVQCPGCGHRFDVLCPDCARQVVWRQHVISDFLIGGHAAAQADALLTRDRGYFRTYFPRLTLLVPAP